jgi:hypothetical protein
VSRKSTRLAALANVTSFSKMPSSSSGNEGSSSPESLARDIIAEEQEWEKGVNAGEPNISAVAVLGESAGEDMVHDGDISSEGSLASAKRVTIKD